MRLPKEPLKLRRQSAHTQPTRLLDKRTLRAFRSEISSYVSLGRAPAPAPAPADASSAMFYVRALKQALPETHCTASLTTDKPQAQRTSANLLR